MNLLKYSEMPVFKQLLIYLIYQIVANISMYYEYILVRSVFHTQYLHVLYLLLIVILTIYIGSKLKYLLLKIPTIFIFVVANIYAFCIGGLVCGEAI
jgi:hypothetical protein